jgi:hypothetical protein
MPRYLWKIQLADTYGLSTFLEENIGGVYTGRPTKKHRKMTIRQFFIQLCRCPKFILCLILATNPSLKQPLPERRNASLPEMPLIFLPNCVRAGRSFLEADF